MDTGMKTTTTTLGSWNTHTHTHTTEVVHIGERGDIRTTTTTNKNDPVNGNGQMAGIDGYRFVHEDSTAPRC